MDNFYNLNEEELIKKANGKLFVKNYDDALIIFSRILELNLGLYMELTDSGPPEKIIPFGFNFKSSLGDISQETISDKTPISLILLAISWVYCEPKSRITILS